VGKAQGSKPRDLVRNPEMGSPRPPNPKARYIPDPDPAEDGEQDMDEYEGPGMIKAGKQDLNEPEVS
jgi:hypothetical protein